MISTSYYEYFLSIITFNIFLYTLLVYSLFSLFFVFDIKFVKTLNELKDMNYIDGIITSIVLIFLSLAGIPPLLGFISKFLLFIYFTLKANFFLLFLIIMFNLFTMFFYLQNIRYLTSTNPKNYFNIKNNFVFLNQSMLLFIIILNVFGIFGIFITNDFVIFFNCICSYII